ncbi:MAG: ATPase, T2SS/T4P/T4SS family, partial [bacterium]
PDIILVGEMRDLETIQTAITAAETGHLVLATLHTPDATQTIDRIIDVFPPHQQQQVRIQLAANLQGIISQVLLKRADGKGRIAAFEVLIAVPAVRNLIREGRTYQIPSFLQVGRRQGMVSLNQSLIDLSKEGLISPEEAISKATDVAELQSVITQEGEGK